MARTPEVAIQFSADADQVTLAVQELTQELRKLGDVQTQAAISEERMAQATTAAERSLGTLETQATDTGGAVSRTGGLLQGMITTATGAAIAVGGKLAGAITGLKGLLAGAATSVINFTAVGVLKMSAGLREAAESTRDAEGELSTIGRTADVAASGLEKVAKTALIISGVITGLQVAAAAAIAGTVVASARAAAEFTPAFNRVRTLVQGTPQEMDALRDSVSSLAAELGIEGAEAADTFYQVLSALPQLASEPVRALEILRVALEAGSTGFTDAATAAEAITAVMNAFSLEAEDARRVSDALFAAQDQGVLTFGEVASSIGTVADLTASLGGRFEDLLGIVATITPSGLGVSETFTQIRAALNNILKPSEDAKQAARELGVDFSATALKTKGLNGFLLDLIETTDGRTDQLSRFFGSQEALNLVVALARQTDVLREKTELVGSSAGSTSAKVDTMNESFERQKEILDQQLAGALRDVGFEFEAMGATGLRVVNSLIRGLRELASVTPGDIVRTLQGVGRRTAPRLGVVQGDVTAGPAVAPSADGRVLPGLFRTVPRAAVAPPPEPATLERAQQKIADLTASLQAQATLLYARTESMEQYEAATEKARVQVNKLVVAEMDRLRAAGVETAAINELASAYQIPTKRAQKLSRATQAAGREAEQVLRGQAELALAASKITLEQTERTLKSSLARNLISYRAYYAELTALQQAAIDEEIAAREAELARTRDPSDRLRIERELVELQAKRAGLAIENAQAQQEAEQRLADQVEQIQLRLLEAEGNTAEARRLRLEAEFRELIERLEAEGDTAGVEIVHRLINVEQAKARMDELAAEIQGAEGRLSSELQRIAAEQAVGSLSESQARQAVVQQYEELLSTLVRLRDSYRTTEVVAVLGADAAAAAYNRVQKEIEAIAPSLARAREATQELQLAIGQAITSDLTSFLTEGIAQAESLGGAFRSLAADIVSSLQRIIAQIIAYRIVAAVFGQAFAGPAPFGGGGGATGRATGGLVRGAGTATSDSVPAWLSNGEYVIRASVVRKLGPRFFDEINLGANLPAIRRLRGEEHYAAGGLVRGGSRADAPGGAGGDSRLTVGLEDGLVLRELESSAGQRTMVKTLERNRRTVRRALGLG